jgi:peptidoglycan/xylan/chitin deacetylase (PgdA/CDA1 family)
MLAKRIANRARDLLFAPPFDAMWRKRARGRIAVLLYHRVDEPGNSFIDEFGVPPIPPAQLRGELEFLRAHGARFLSIDELRHPVELAPDEFGVAVTFDDGFRCNYGPALDVLADMGVRACIFQSTAMVDSAELIWEHALYYMWSDPDSRTVVRRLIGDAHPQWRTYGDRQLLDAVVGEMPAAQTEHLVAQAALEVGATDGMRQAAAQLYPSSDDLRRAIARGHEVGAHGHHHYPRRNIDAPTFAHELAASRQCLAAILGKAPKAFSYPFNSYVEGDHPVAFDSFEDVFTVDAAPLALPLAPREPRARFTWPGPHRNALRRRRWLWAFADGGPTR